MADDSIRYKVAVVGAAETTNIGKVEGMSNLMLAADAAMNAIRDCGIDKNKIDGVFSASLGGVSMVQMCHYLGITPKIVDGTAVGGTSFLLHVRHAAAALAMGYCDYALVLMGESGYTRGDNIGLPGGRGGGSWRRCQLDRRAVRGALRRRSGPRRASAWAFCAT